MSELTVSLTDTLSKIMLEGSKNISFIDLFDPEEIFGCGVTTATGEIYFLDDGYGNPCLFMEIDEKKINLSGKTLIKNANNELKKVCAEKISEIYSDLYEDEEIKKSEMLKTKQILKMWDKEE